MNPKEIQRSTLRKNYMNITQYWQNNNGNYVKNKLYH